MITYINETLNYSSNTVLLSRLSCNNKLQKDRKSYNLYFNFNKNTTQIMKHLNEGELIAVILFIGIAILIAIFAWIEGTL